MKNERPAECTKSIPNVVVPKQFFFWLGQPLRLIIAFHCYEGGYIMVEEYYHVTKNWASDHRRNHIIEVREKNRDTYKP